MRGIYRYTLDCRRMGDLEGVFVADERLVESAMEMAADVGLHFGEVLGKHSEITDNGSGAYTLLSTDPRDIETFERLNLTTGINPVGYYLNQEDEDEEEA